VGRGELVHGQVRPPGRRTDLLGGAAGDAQQVRSVISHGDSRGGQQLAQARGFRGADKNAARGGVAGEVLDARLADELAASQHHQPGRRLRHLAHQVRRDENRPSFGGERLEQLPDPAHAVRVQAVDRLVQHHRLRLAQQRRSDAQALPHAERETAGPAARDLAQPGQLNHLIDPATSDTSRPGERQQITAG
jgi:hypothetical protein